MSEPFLAEVRIFGFNFPPRGWAACDGQILPINQNQSLYSLLGTTYGGDGRTTFALPDMRGRTPVHPGNNGVTLGQKAGAETHTLSVAELPAHSHAALAAETATTNDPTGKAPAGGGAQVFNDPHEPVSLGPSGTAGGGQAHENMQPYLAMNFCIALQGIFPSRN